MRNIRHKRYLRFLLGTLAGLGILLAWSWLPVFSQPSAALAHAFVIGSYPEDGSTIQSAPAVVRIYFNADISTASRAQVFVFTPGGSADGREVDSGSSVIPATNPKELDTALLSPATLPQGSYEVRWTAVASDDGNATHGLIGFNVGVSATGLTGDTILGPSTSNILPQMNLQGLLATLWAWITLLALTFWIGLIVMEAIFAFGVMPSMQGAAENAIRMLRKQGRPLQWLCLSTLLVGECINLALRSIILSQFQQNGAIGIDLSDVRAILLQTSYGYLWFVRVGLIGCALIYTWWIARAAERPLVSKQRRAIHTLREQFKSDAAQRPTSAQASPASQSSRYRQLRLQLGDELTPDDDARPKISEQDQSRTLATARPAVLGATPGESLSASRRHAVTWLLLASLIVLTIAFSGDSAQLAQAHTTAIVLNWLYLLAQAAWLGGVAYLAFVLLPLLRTIEAESHSALLVNVLRYFVPLLLAALGILLLSGLFSVETTINSPDQWLNDPYGRTMLVTLLLFTLMLLFTAYSFFYVLPALRRQLVLLPVVNAELPARRARHSALDQSISSLRRATHILAVLGAGILLCAALMAFYAPPIVFPPLPATSNTAGNSSTGDSTQGIQMKTVGNLVIALQVTPARIGTTNQVIITLKDTSGNPISNAHVQISTNMQLMDMGQANKDVQGQSGIYTASFTPNEAFSMQGVWIISLSIQQPGQSPTQAQFFMTLTA